MERKYLTGCMPLLAPSITFKTYGGPDVVITTTIFDKRRCKTSPGEQECHIIKAHLDIRYHKKNYMKNERQASLS